MAKAKAEGSTVTETGTVLGRTLQEKQIAALDKAKTALEGVIDGYTTNIAKLNDELTDMYYKIQEKEIELVEMERAATKGREATVEMLKTNIADLEKQYSTKMKDFQVDFELNVKANKQKVMQLLMQEDGLATIKSDELSKLQAKVKELEDLYAKGYDTEVVKVKAALEREYKNTNEKLVLTHEKEQSTNAARIEQMESQVKFLEGQLAKAEERVINILDNQVKIAQADKGIVINTSDKK